MRGSDRRLAISGAVKLRFSPPNSDRMPSPWASAGTMYLFSEGSDASDIPASVEHEAAVDRQQLAGDEARALARAGRPPTPVTSSGICVRCMARPDT